MKVRILSTKQVPAMLRRIGQVFVRPARALAVKRREVPYWQERGWKQTGKVLRGTFQTAYGSFIGRIDEVAAHNFRLYVLEPPAELGTHSHWTCFEPQGDGRTFRIHLSRMPKDASSAILSIERLLTEAFEGQPRR